MKVEDFETLKKYAEEDTALPDNIEQVMQVNNLLPSTVQKWTKLYTTQKYLISQLKVNLNKIYGECYYYYKFNDNVSWGTTKEIESQIYKDPKYLAAVKEYDTQKYYFDFIEETLTNIKNLGFTIKNYLDYKKMLYTTG
jgi:hypothetical protein